MTSFKTALLCLAVSAAAFSAAASAQAVPVALRNDLTHFEPRSAFDTLSATPASRILQQSEAGEKQQEGVKAVGEVADGADEKGGGEEDEAEEAATRYWIYVHAILMSVAWVGLLPRESETCGHVCVCVGGSCQRCFAFSGPPRNVAAI